MRPTLNYFYQKYREYNRQLFNGELPAIPIRYSRSRRKIGATRYQLDDHHQPIPATLCILMSVYYDLAEEEYIDTLVHEMIHCYIIVKGINDNGKHGAEFQRIMREINAKGVRVSLNYTPSAEDVSSALIRARYVFVVEWKDGRTGITVSAKTRLFELWRAYEGAPEVRSFRLYGSLDPWFGEFPAVTKAKVYFPAPEQLRQHLSGAVEMQKKGRYIMPK